MTPDRSKRHRQNDRNRPHSGRPRPPQSRRGPARSRGAGGGAIWLYGRHAALAALANPARRIERALASDGFQEAHADALARAGAGERWPLETADSAKIDRALGAGAVHQGIAIAARHGMFDGPDLDGEPRSPEGVIVAFLGLVQESLVGALLDAAEDNGG